MKARGYLKYLVVALLATLLIASSCSNKTETQKDDDTKVSQKSDDKSDSQSDKKEGTSDNSNNSNDASKSDNNSSDKSETAESSKAQDGIPNDMPFPKDFKKVDDLSSTITTNNITTASLTFDTNESQDALFEMYKKYLEAKGDVTTTTTADQKQLSCIKDNTTYYFVITPSEDSGFKTMVSLIVQTQK